jgi:hypothetical protein
MTEFPKTKPQMSAINHAQDLERNIRRQMAKARFYLLGNFSHTVGSICALVFALASPFVLIYRPDFGPYLGAIAGIWIFASRLLFESINQKCQAKGAASQELFDCDVLGLPWNNSLARQPTHEEIRRASKAYRTPKRVERHKGWYPSDEEFDWPQSVIVCQRSNAVWGCRQHRAYGWTLRLFAAAWFIIGVVFAINHGASLAEYITTIAFPSLPALLDATDISKRHLLAAARREEIGEEANRLFDDSSVDHETLREVQDRIFELRRTAPAVAWWFYRVVRGDFEADMRYAAAQMAKRGDS